MSDRKIENRKQSGPGPGGGGPMGGGMRKIEKAKNFKGTMNKLLQYLKPYKLSILVVILFAIGSAAFTIVGPKILGNATTKLFEGLVSKVSGAPGAAIDFTYIGNIVILLLGLYILSTVFGIIQGYIISGVAQKYLITSEKKSLKKLTVCR